MPSTSTRITITAIGVIAILAAATRAADAQTQPEHKRSLEFLVSTGAMVPTGTQGDAVKRGKLTAAQLSYVVRPTIAFNATLGWARTRDIASAGDPRLDVFTYDLGAEVRAPRWLTGNAVTFSPFAGAGVGGRSYNYRSLDVDATHNIAAYASAGGELGRGRVRLRVEARDYVTGFKPLVGEGSADTRNDVVVMAGLRFTSR